MKKLILASSSPRRKDILCSIGLDFEVIESKFDESSVNREFNPCDYSKALAHGKALNVHKMVSDSIVLAADTIVVLDNKIYGKPKDLEDAAKMLRSLSGKIHDVITGVALIDNLGRVVIDIEITKVFFNDLDERDIDAYIRTKDYVGKAGAYGIQGRGAVLIKRIEGSYSNVVGLPIETVCRMFKKIDERIYERWN